MQDTESKLYFIKFLSEPRIRFKEVDDIINPAAIMHNKPYSYDELIENCHIAFFCRDRYKNFFATLANDLITILNDNERYGLNVPEDSIYPIVYHSDASNVTSLINEIVRESDARLVAS